MNEEEALAPPLADNRFVLASQVPWYCIECGVQLEPGHRFCWRCGTPRWTPSEAAPAPSAPTPPGPAPTTEGLRGGRSPVAAADLGVLPWLYAAGAIFCLVWATRTLAYLLAPAGRSQLTGMSGDLRPSAVVISGFIFIGMALVAVGLHAAAFYGLRRKARWGWLAAVVVAGFWSLLIVGLPVLLRLISRNVRQSFGME
jgi:hypothetical protein